MRVGDLILAWFAVLFEQRKRKWFGHPGEVSSAFFRARQPTYWHSKRRVSPTFSFVTFDGPNRSLADRLFEVELPIDWFCLDVA